jgi:sulfite oxidase
MFILEKKAQIVHLENPFNAAPDLSELGQHEITPNETFFHRNHGNIPQIDAESYRLKIIGLVEKSLSLSIDDLKALPKHSLTATISCAGNRRRELHEISDLSAEVLWDAHAVGTALWTGCRMRDILEMAGLPKNQTGLHLAFTGLDEVNIHGGQGRFGGSIALEKALGDEVLLAYEMNGEALSAEHGFPLRLVVGGYIGARSIKWLGEIKLQAEESQNYFQQNAYKLFPPHVSKNKANWSEGQTLTEQPLNSIISFPKNQTVLPNGKIVMRGFAIAQGANTLERVEVSNNNGRTWQEAKLLTEPQAWKWSLWQAELDLDAGIHRLAVRAFDSAGNHQPEDKGAVWNFKGYFNNAWHRVSIVVR